MKALNFIPALMIAAVALSGCDRVRSILGKPTSDDIEQARLAKESAEKAEKDSIAAVAQALEQQQREAEAAAKHICRYNVIVGSFKEKANADRMANQLTAAGETAIQIEFKNDLTAVSILNTDDFHAACRKLNHTQTTDDLPFDCWIYDALTSQHK